MSKPGRSASEETELRKIVAKLVDHVLEMKAEAAANNKVIAARLDTLESEVKANSKKLAKIDTALDTLTKLARDNLKKTNDLHRALVDSSNTLGQRLHDLEQERTTRAGRADRAPSRG